MNRLTERNENRLAILNIKCPEGCEYSTCSLEEGYQCQHQCERDIIEKLAEYEDLDEQGLLLRLPCKVGDTVYAIRYGEENDFIVVETKIIEIRQNINGTFFNPLISRKAYKTEDFGKEVFLTKSEAEKKLKEMESD